MVLKKPYAFLIKHFKLIHLLLCIPLVYLLIRTGAIANFLNTYVQANYYTNQTNLAGLYINYFMYLAILLVLLLVLAIYLLMRQKKKDTRFYLFLLFYYVLLFALITFCHSILNQIESTTLEAQTIRIYRDISLIIYLPQFFFVGYSFLRGIGFDVKKFNFDEDAKELEITDIDNEEFELVFGKDAYKYKRTIRRFFREFKYYILENKIGFSILASVVVVVLGTLLYLNFGVYNKVYRQTENMNHNGLVISVEKAILTNLDIGGNTLNKYYMALAVNIKNNKNSNTVLDYENFLLNVGGRFLKPILDQSANFPELGYPYINTTKIDANSSKTYVLVYEVDSSLINQPINLKILDSVTFEIGSVTPIYKTVNLKYEIIDKNTIVRVVDYNKILELSDTSLGMSQIRISNYQINNSYEYTYQSCYYNICQDVKNKVTANSSNTLLILNRMFQLDTYSMYYNVRKGSTNFINDFIKIEYTINDKKYTIKPNDVTPKEINDYWIFETNSDISTASTISLLINIRGNLYRMKVK